MCYDEVAVVVVNTACAGGRSDLLTTGRYIANGKSGLWERRGVPSRVAFDYIVVVLGLELVWGFVKVKVEVERLEVLECSEARGSMMWVHEDDEDDG